MVNYECLSSAPTRSWRRGGVRRCTPFLPLRRSSIADSPFRLCGQQEGRRRRNRPFWILQGYLLSDEVQKRDPAPAAAPVTRGCRRRNADVFRADWGVQPDRVLSPIRMPSTDVLMECLDLYQTQFRKPPPSRSYCLGLPGSMEGLAGNRWWRP